MISYELNEGIILKNCSREAVTELFSSNIEQIYSVAEWIPSSKNRFSYTLVWQSISSVF